MSDSLRPHESQHTRPRYPSTTPGVYPNSCPLSWWCHLTISSSLLLLPSFFPNIRVFSDESALCNRWPKYWSFSFNISPSSEHPGLSSFRMDWLDLLAVYVELMHFIRLMANRAITRAWMKLTHTHIFIIKHPSQPNSLQSYRPF